MKRAFETGGTGFLGAHLICTLLKEGYGVDALFRSEIKIKDFLYIAQLHQLSDAMIQNRLFWHHGDLMDVALLDAIITQEHRIFHVAGMVSFNERKAVRMYETNTLGTAQLVNICIAKQVHHFCHVSSTSAVGKTNTEHDLITEDTPWNRDAFHSAYAQSKHKAELEVWRGIEEGLNASMVNPGVILGSGNWNYGTCRLFNLIHKGLPFYSPGLNGFVAVEDVTKAMLWVSEHRICAERFILVSENRSFKEILDLIAVHLGKKGPQFRISTRIILSMGKLASFLRTFGIRLPISRDYARSSVARHAYSSSKYLQASGSTFTSMDHCISKTASDYTAFLDTTKKSSK